MGKASQLPFNGGHDSLSVKEKKCQYPFLFALMFAIDHLNEEQTHLQEKPLVMTAVGLLGCLDELLGGIHCLTTGQQLSVQGLQLTLLFLLQSGGPFVVSLG